MGKNISNRGAVYDSSRGGFNVGYFDIGEDISNRGALYDSSRGGFNVGYFDIGEDISNCGAMNDWQGMRSALQGQPGLQDGFKVGYFDAGNHGFEVGYFDVEDHGVGIGYFDVGEDGFGGVGRTTTVRTGGEPVPGQPEQRDGFQVGYFDAGTMDLRLDISMLKIMDSRLDILMVERVDLVEEVVLQQPAPVESQFLSLPETLMALTLAILIAVTARLGISIMTMAGQNKFRIFSASEVDPRVTLFA